jgi:hypothetical protein
MERQIDRLFCLAAAALLLAGCSKSPEPEKTVLESRLADAEYVQKLDVERAEQTRIQSDLEVVRQALEILKAEDPELTGDKAKELQARQKALLKEFGESRGRAAATVRARIFEDIQKEKINAMNLQKKGK